MIENPQSHEMARSYEGSEVLNELNTQGETIRVNSLPRPGLFPQQQPSAR